MARRNTIDLPDSARRSFIKWTIGVGAALGLRPWKVFEVGESVIGPAFAADACASVNRFVGSIMGNGGFAWMTQLWPFPEIARAPGQSFYATNQAVAQVGSDKPFFLSPDAPKLAGKKMTAFICGTNETHTIRPTSASTIGTGTGMFAAVAALQTASPTLVPSIGIGMLPYGAAAGAPPIASVASASGMVDLFNSASSTAGGALVNAKDASLFEAYYKANLSLFRAAARPTFMRGFMTGKVASNLLGKNLASQLAPTADDFTRYGITGSSKASLKAIAEALITTYKAFKLNLTSAVLIPGTADDPHGAFNDMADLQNTVATFGKIYDGFMGDMMNEPDPLCAGAKLGDNLVMTWTGDTPKNPNNPSGWPDGTPGNSNWMYVLGANQLKTGWYGQIHSDGSVSTWNPTTGQDVAGGSSANMADPAGGAVLHAVTKGDARRVQDFYRGPGLDGVAILKQI